MISWSVSIDNYNLKCKLLFGPPAVAFGDFQSGKEHGQKKHLSQFNFPLFGYLADQFPDHLNQYYLQIESDAGVVAFATIQLIDFSFFDYINEKKFNKDEGARNLIRRILYKPGKLFDGSMLVLGHMLLSGVKTSWIADDFPLALKEHWWPLILESVANNCFEGVEHFSALVVVANGEDVNSPDFSNFGSWISSDIYPIMELRLDSKWKNFDDYIDSLRSRYKKKVRTVIEKSTDINIRTFSLKDVKIYEKEIMALFKTVLDASSYKLLEPESQFFTELMQMDDLDYHINGVFHRNKLVAFYSWFNYDGVTEGHYLGYDKTYLLEFDLYKFLLLNLIDKTIAAGSKSLVLGRTATIVKADLGAQAVPSKVLIRPVGFFRRVLFPIYYAFFFNRFSFRKRNVFR